MPNELRVGPVADAADPGAPTGSEIVRGVCLGFKLSLHCWTTHLGPLRRHAKPKRTPWGLAGMPAHQVIRYSLHSSHGCVTTGVGDGFPPGPKARCVAWREPPRPDGHSAMTGVQAVPDNPVDRHPRQAPRRAFGLAGQCKAPMWALTEARGAANARVASQRAIAPTPRQGRGPVAGTLYHP